MSVAVETRALTKTYGNINAVDKLDLNVPKGAIYGFLGPNGAGKTTTLKMLTGLIRPTSGEIFVFGKKVLFGDNTNLHNIGFLPDVPGFYNWMSASDYLEFCGKLFRFDNVSLKRKTTELLKLVRLEDTGKKKISGFSRGMKQRLGIAQALINDPELILLDEPVSALDPVGRKEVMDIISKLSGRVTVFFSTHVLEDVERICDRVVIIKEGRALIEDTIENIKSKDPTRQIEIELEKMDGLSEALNGLDWIEEIKSNNGKKLVISVNDTRKAAAELTKLISDKKLILKKFNVLEPTLEDIFIKVVSSI